MISNVVLENTLVLWDYIVIITIIAFWCVLIALLTLKIIKVVKKHKANKVVETKDELGDENNGETNL